MSASRRSQRIPLQQFVTYDWAGRTTRAKSSNLSEQGFFLETTHPASLGTRLRLRFVLDGQRIATEGVVVRSSPPMGMGVEFTCLSDEHRSIIRSFVGELAPQCVGTEA